MHYQHSIKFCLDFQQNGGNEIFNLLSRLPLDGPSVEGPAAGAGPAEVTPTGAGLFALRLRAERGGLVQIGAAVVAGDGVGSGWLVRVPGARDCNRDLTHLSDKLHPCFPLLHWKHAQSSFLAQGNMRQAQWSHQSVAGRIGKLGGGW